MSGFTRYSFLTFLVFSVGIVGPAIAEEENDNQRDDSYFVESDVDVILDNVRRGIEFGNEVEAIKILQLALDKHSLVSGKIDFVPILRKLESPLRSWSTEQINLYRSQSLIESNQLYKKYGKSRSVEVLEDMVHRYFFSKIGDQAAFELAGIELDRQNASKARRLLQKIAEEISSLRC